ncbi:hypothetical protein Rrhod_1101 [Rhodococcus rhodnii LMG 5362]|uniref:AB hydrolase-1 domain-containing protein n=1 Tax=Rhodococcus rhodnii LMG 5362 TaxID=1273125 RepID=R7WQI9_9NOCA|nr:hypothetical protein Rrhod_1101 [Rhodococcus rhodnii LMG 5362]
MTGRTDTPRHEEFAVNAERPTGPTRGIVHSADGTPIAWSRAGAGPDLVMVHCVGVSRATTPQPTLPAELARHFTVWTYDRRGKGESGTADTYDVQREIEDLEAVIGLTSGPATVYGFSSGATLALIAAESGAPIHRLALLEPPLFAAPDPDREFLTEGERQLAEGPRSLHEWFQIHVVGVPDEVLAELPPVADETLRDAASILHELAFLPGTPAERFRSVSRPTLIVASDSTAPEIHGWGRELEEQLPDARLEILPGEWHGVDDATLTAAIGRFVDGAHSPPAFA